MDCNTSKRLIPCRRKDPVVLKNEFHLSFPAPQRVEQNAGESEFRETSLKSCARLLILLVAPRQHLGLAVLCERIEVCGGKASSGKTEEMKPS